ncbi:MAG: PKD domain-containing protein [Hahellaceae bacterium]|nr:PKD domain-containing protein [Hahellaceae bacterium]
MRLKTIYGYSLLAGMLTLQGCIFDESGKKYDTPNSSTEPKASINYSPSNPLPTYLTFAENSADLTVQFGSQRFNFGGSSEMRLKAFGFDGHTYDAVWRQSVMDDSRGIKGVRVGYYRVESSGNDKGTPSFHFLAKDSSGNIYLTETYDQLSSEVGTTPFRQPQPEMLFPAKVKVGDSWLSGASLVPWFYDFNAGWIATLVDDNATAPVSGETNCILIKFNKQNRAYYLYLKSGVGVVEWLNNWTESNGRIQPVDGFAITVRSAFDLGPEYTGWGWGNDSRNAVGTYTATTGLVMPNGMAAFTVDTTTYPQNNSGYDFYQLTGVGTEDANVPLVTALTIPKVPGESTVEFSDDVWDTLSGTNYQPGITVRYKGNTYVANASVGKLQTTELYPYWQRIMQQDFMVQGQLVNQANSSDTLNFVTLVSGAFGTHINSDAGRAITVFRAFGDRSLPSASPGEELRIYYSHKNLPSAARETLYIGSTANDVTQEADGRFSCFGDVDSNQMCNTLHRAYTIKVPESEGTRYLQWVTKDASGTELYRSEVYSLPIARRNNASTAPTARILDAFPEEIRGRLENGKFSIGYINALSSDDADGGNIVKYTWDMGDGNVFEDASPLGGYTYTKEGTFQIKLTVTDNNGLTNTAYRKVVVSNNGTIEIRNVGYQFASGWVYVGIENMDNSDGYYDHYRFVYLDKDDKETFTLDGNHNYQIDIIDDDKIISTRNIYLQAGENFILEFNNDK